MPSDPTTQTGVGEVRVNSVDLILSTPDVRVWHIDLATKYAEVPSYTADAVILTAGARTLRIDDTRKGEATVVPLDVPVGWDIVVDPFPRYTVRVVAYRIPD